MSSKRFAGEVIWGSCALGFNETCFGFCVFAATVAATGLYFREGNKYEDLWVEHGESSGCNLRQRAIVRDLLQLWVPYIQLSDIAAALTAHKNGVTGRLDRLKGNHRRHGAGCEDAAPKENH